MKFVYLTAKTYPASTADHIYILELAKGFHTVLKDDFLLVVANNLGDDLRGLPVLDLHLSFRHFKTLFYFFWLPYFALQSENNTVFFSNDPNLLAMLIFWKRILPLEYRIYSDWHMLFGDWRDRFIQRNSDRLVTTSNKLKQAIVALSGIKEGKVLTAYGGIDLGNYEQMNKDDARDRMHLPKDKKIIAYIGFFKTMGMEKGIRTMIGSLPMLPTEVIMLFVGGKESEISEYREYAESINVASRCIFVGRKSQDELALYETASDILAIPYPDKPHFRDFGFPMKVYEYMASHRPIIYSKLDLAEEVIGDCAYSFTPDDGQSFAGVVKEILSNEERALEYASRAYEKVKKYTWESKAGTILRNVRN